jgi:hypothetical protein
MTQQVGNIAPLSREEIIDTKDVMPLLDQSLAKKASEKPGGSRHEDTSCPGLGEVPHACSPCRTEHVPAGVLKMPMVQHQPLKLDRETFDRRSMDAVAEPRETFQELCQASP